MTSRRSFSYLSVLAILGALCALQGACGNNQNPAGKPGGNESSPTGPEVETGRKAEMVRLTDSQMKEFGVETGPAAPGRLKFETVFPGEVVLNADRIAHVAPRVPGVVRDVRKNLGDTVRQGEVLAVLESRDLADSTASLLAARERLTLAQTNLDREEQVWRKRISPEQDYLEAKNRLAEARIELRTAELKLRALGFSGEYIAALPGRKDEGVTLYEIVAPFAGTVMQKNINQGMVLRDDSAAFVIADLSTVWVNLDIPQKDLPLIKVGQAASIGTDSDPVRREGHVSFIEPIATETNRTIHARVVVPNSDGRLRPGLFVNGRILTDEALIPVLVSSEALVTVDGAVCVFVREDSGFRLQPVRTGRTDGSRIEIARGLSPGQLYATKGAFTLKSELEKPEAEE